MVGWGIYPVLFEALNFYGIQAPGLMIDVQLLDVQRNSNND